MGSPCPEFNPLSFALAAFGRSFCLRAFLLGPLSEPGSWSEMQGYLFRFTYLAAIAVAMVSWVSGCSLP